jgi:hypothetical protein
MYDHISKPIVIAEFMQTLPKALSKRKGENLVP